MNECLHLTQKVPGKLPWGMYSTDRCHHQKAPSIASTLHTSYGKGTLRRAFGDDTEARIGLFGNSDCIRL